MHTYVIGYFPLKFHTHVCYWWMGFDGPDTLSISDYYVEITMPPGILFVDLPNTLCYCVLFPVLLFGSTFLPSIDCCGWYICCPATINSAVWTWLTDGSSIATPAGVAPVTRGGIPVPCIQLLLLPTISVYCVVATVAIIPLLLSILLVIFR